MTALLSCPRRHYWRYECGLDREEVGLALRIGSAWARAMEARWKEASYEDALTAAVSDCELDELTVATISGLLAGYYSYYGERETLAKINPEVQFDYALDGSRTFNVAGKMDGLGTKHDGRSAIIENKTTGDSIDAGSDYWLRLRFNTQVYQYILASRKLGWDISEVIYDVTRKPSIKPKQINDLDEKGNKIVNDSQGNRVYKKNGTPRESGSEADGYTVQTHLETPDEYCDRLIYDCKTRPEFYFARREVPILEDELKEFEAQRLSLSRMILDFRQNEKRLDRPEQAWPRNVSENTCTFCQFASFCLQNISVNPDQPPQGYAVKAYNPELETQNI